MKNILTLLFLMLACSTFAQESFFRGNNNYVKPLGPPTLVATGLVLNLDAGDASSYPGNGNTWNDLSGSNHGTLVNGPTFDPGNGGSIVFDGIDDVVSLGNVLNMGVNSWTISCWVKFDGGTSGLMGIIGKTSYRPNYGRYAIYIDNNNLVAFCQPSNGNMIVSTPLAPYLDNNFHNLVVTINRTSVITFYIDGISVGTPYDISSTSTANPISSDNFYIGSYASNTGQSPLYFFKGSIGQALIYNRALSPTEVTNNFNVSKARYGL